MDGSKTSQQPPPPRVLFRTWLLYNAMCAHARVERLSEISTDQKGEGWRSSLPQFISILVAGSQNPQILTPTGPPFLYVNPSVDVHNL